MARLLFEEESNHKEEVPQTKLKPLFPTKLRTEVDCEDDSAIDVCNQPGRTHFIGVYIRPTTLRLENSDFMDITARETYIFRGRSVESLVKEVVQRMYPTKPIDTKYSPWLVKNGKRLAEQGLVQLIFSRDAGFDYVNATVKVMLPKQELE